jgi:thymidylate synthase
MYVNSDFDINRDYPALIDDILSVGVEVDIARPGALSTITRELHPAVLSCPTPRRRLVTSHGRPVNVAFALAEVLWILGGREDVEMLAAYNSNIAQFSDDGVRFNAPYGKRLRRDFGHDQIDDAIRTLLDDSSSRQAVMAIWNPVDDKGWLSLPVEAEGGIIEMAHPKKVTKDRACNLVAQPMIRDGKLDWTQTMRSNDAIWGLPYNLMQWTHLQEWFATILEVPVGTYHHIANSLHIYEAHMAEASNISVFDLYETLGDHPEMMAGPEVLNVLLREELIIRTTQQAWTPPDDAAETIGAYWHGVLGVLWAHRLYTEGLDGEALRFLLLADKVYGCAQARFCYQNRWHKEEYKEMVETQLRPQCPDHIFNWITTRVEA